MAGRLSRVCVLGLGSIGLPTAAMLASRGVEVIGCDIDPRVVARVNAGRPHVREPDLDRLLAQAVRTGRLRAQGEPAEAEAFLIAVPTPVGRDHAPDLSFVDAAARSIAPLLRPGDLVVLESTVPVGTTERIAANLAAARPDLAFPRYGETPPRGAVHVAHCPERVLPSAILRELVANDRVLGGLTPACAEKARALYATFVTAALLLTDCRTAELVKLAENAFRDVNLAFANELAAICERLGVDVWRAIALANRHPRVAILRPGAGVGGHCIPLDPWFLIGAAPDEARLLRTARAVNDDQPMRVAARIAAAASSLREPVVACFGLTYKPDVADLRESPALAIVHALAERGGLELFVCDPWVEALPESLAGSCSARLVGPEEALARADVVAFLVPHAAFRGIDPERLAGKRVIDPAGVLAEG